MDRTTLPSDSGYGGSDLHGKMAKQGQFDQQYLNAPFNSTNDGLFLPPMSGSYQDYREGYAPSVSVFSGNELLPDPIYSPSDFDTDQNMGQQYAGDEALAGTGALLPLSLSQMDMNTTSPTLTLHRGSSGFQQDNDTTDFAPGVTDFLDNHHIMKRPHAFDAPISPNKKRSVGPPSNPDPSFGTFSSPGSSQMLSRNLSSGGQSWQYPLPNSETYAVEQTQLQGHNPGWPAQIQEDPSPIEDELIEQHESPSNEKPKKAKKKYPCNECPVDKAFTTSNDLERHMKTVHGRLKRGDKVWLCNIENCRGGRKVWARMDNFKQHITRMHQRNNTDVIERMCVNFDPNLHDIQISKNKNRKPSEGSAGGETEPLNISALFGNPQINRSQIFTPNTVSHGDTSMQNNDSLSLTASSSHVRPQQRQRGGSSSNNPNHRVVRKSAATIANHELIAERRHEIRSQETGPTQVYTPGPTQQDFLNLGSNLALEFQENARAGQIDLRRLSQPGLIDPKIASITENHILEMIDRMPVESRNRLRTRLNMPQGSSSQTRQRSASTPKLQSVKKADSVKDEMTQMCSKPGCGKIYAKAAELRKHEHRHARKYGCTFDQCFGKFGTKWEWKRHERSQHAQDTEWRCDLNVADKACGQAFNDDARFRTHLKGQHRLSESAVQQKFRTCELTKKWIGSFWCGFCVEIIQIPGLSGPESYNARYTHISDHIDNKENPCNISQWIEVHGGGKTKMEVKKSLDDASLRSPTESVSPNTEHNDGNSSDCSGEEDDSQENIPADAEPQSLHMNTAQAIVSQPGHSQPEFPNTRSPKIMVTPADYYTSQSPFPNGHFYNNALQQQRSISDFGPHGFGNPFARLSACGSCGSGLVMTSSGFICPGCDQACEPNIWSSFVNTEQMDN